MPKVEADYSNLVIYKICCKDPTVNDIYIGHTTNFVKRKYQHSRSYLNCNSHEHYKKLYVFMRDNGGWENWSMLQVEEFKCNTKREAEAREHFWIERLGATLNCIMPYAMCKEHPVEYKKEWYIENKEHVLYKHKQRYEEKKDIISVYQKEYAEKNKDKLNAYNEEYREKNKESLSYKKKDYRESHKEEISETLKEWRLKNKDKIKEIKSAVISCECGSNYTFGNKHRHLQSKLHVTWQNISQYKPDDVEDENYIISQNLENKAGEDVATENTKDRQKQYRIEHSEKISEYKKNYNDVNKEKIRLHNKSYYEKNKEALKEKASNYSENSKDKVKEYKDEWYQKNKAQILEKQKKLYTCECGAEVRCAGRAEHNRSMKHQNFVAGSNPTF